MKDKCVSSGPDCPTFQPSSFSDSRVRCGDVETYTVYFDKHAPTVTSVSPLPGSKTDDVNTKVFGEYHDFDSGADLNQETGARFSGFDPGRKAPPGSLDFATPHEFQWSPSGPWPRGTHTLKLYLNSDVDVNAWGSLGGKTWSFKVECGFTHDILLKAEEPVRFGRTYDLSEIGEDEMRRVRVVDGGPILGDRPVFDRVHDVTRGLLDDANDEVGIVEASARTQGMDTRAAWETTCPLP